MDIIPVDRQDTLVLADGHLALNLVLAVCRFEIHTGTVTWLGLLRATFEDGR